MSRKSGSRPKKRKQNFKKGHCFAPPKVRIIEGGSNSNTNDEDQQPSTSSSTSNVNNSSITTASAEFSRTPKATDRNLPKGTPPSRSKVKLFNLYADMDDSSDDDECGNSVSASWISENDQKEGKGYRLIDLDILMNQIEKNLVCRHCRATTKLVEDKRSGLGSVFRLDCNNDFCKENKQFHSDPTVKVKGSGLVNHSVNRRAALAMRYIGCGHSALQHFCGIMNLPPPVAEKSYGVIKTSLHDAVVNVQSESMNDAAKIEYALATIPPNKDGTDGDETSPRNIDASIDGSYLTKGFSSKIGVVTAIGCVTGKVLDTETKSKVCKGCDMWAKKRESDPDAYRKWLATHPPNCEASHQGSSGSMEAASGVEIYRRSTNKNNLRYTRFIGDGDCNSFKSVAESKPYGDIPVEKIECVGHVQKMMGTRLKKIKTEINRNQFERWKRSWWNR